MPNKFRKGDIVLTKTLRYKDPYWTFEKWLEEKTPLGIAKVIRYWKSYDSETNQGYPLQFKEEKEKEKVVIVNKVSTNEDFHGWYFHEDDLILIERSKKHGRNKKSRKG